MWWNPYRLRFLVDWPAGPAYDEGLIELGWRVRLAIVVVSLALVGLLIALAEWVGG